MHLLRETQQRTGGLRQSLLTVGWMTVRSLFAIRTCEPGKGGVD